MLDPGLHARLTAVTEEFRELEARLADPATISDPVQLRVVSQRYRELEPIVQAYTSLRARLGDLEAAQELHAGAGEKDRPSMQVEVDGALDEVADTEQRLRELLLPRDPHAGRAVIMEIRGDVTTGGSSPCRTTRATSAASTR